jgi:hypothetical protein
MVGRLNMSATVAALLADALLVLHAGIVVFVVGMTGDGCATGVCACCI